MIRGGDERFDRRWFDQVRGVRVVKEIFAGREAEPDLAVDRDQDDIRPGLLIHKVRMTMAGPGTFWWLPGW